MAEGEVAGAEGDERPQWVRQFFSRPGWPVSMIDGTYPARYHHVGLQNSSSSDRLAKEIVSMCNLKSIYYRVFANCQDFIDLSPG